MRSMLNDWQTGKERVARYRDELIPTAGQRVEAALTAYRTGKSDLATTLAARRDEIDSRIQALILELETARAWAQLNFLIPDSSMALAKD
jgi:outer membrane protein TolC